MKTNAVRLLDEAKIPYELREYEVDPNDLAAETVAEKIGMPPEQVFKILVVRGDRNGRDRYSKMRRDARVLSQK